MATKERRPIKTPKGNVLIEFLVDVGNAVKKGKRVVTDKAKADIFVKAKRAKIVKEYGDGEIAKLMRAGKNHPRIKSGVAKNDST